MTVVRLISWTPGFVANPLIALLRENGLSLASAHELAIQFVEGNEVSVCFDDKAKAEAFSTKAELLGVKLASNAGIRIAS